MNDQSETTQGSATNHWFGLDRLRLTDGEQVVDVTIGSETHWDRSHLRRLRQSGDLPGMVPIIDSDFSADGKPFAVTPAIDSPTLTSLLAEGDLPWPEGAGVTEAAARAAHEAHLRGLFHGALSPDDIFIVDEDVAIGGVGLGLGGTPPEDRAEWIAPEVREGADPTERSDVYSLGKVLEASLGESLESVPRSIRRLIMWSSSDTPEARPPSAMEFASILAEGLGDDRSTYGPAFIPTAGTSELATRASSAVSNHMLSSTAQQTATAAGAAGLAAVAATGLAGGRPDDVDPSDAIDDVDNVDDGFSVNVVDTAEFEPISQPDESTVEAEAETYLDAELDTGYDTDVEAETTQVAGSLADDETELGSIELEPEAESDVAEHAATRTADYDETFLPPKRRSRAGYVVAGILAIGVAAIALAVIGSNDETVDSADPNSSTASSTAEATDTTVADATATTADEATATTVAQAPVTTAEEVPASTAEVTTTVSPPTTAPTTQTTEAAAEVERAVPVPMADGPIEAGSAGLQVLHGVPGEKIDVYVDGKAIATGFIAGTVAGPMDMAAGNHEVALFAASDTPPANIADRTDEPMINETVAVGGDAASIVAHLDADGHIAVTPFAEQLSALDPGQGRIMVRHLMNTGEVDAAVAGEIVGTLQPGQEAPVEIDAGSVLVEVLGADGSVITSATVAVDDGELASLSLIGSPADNTAEIVIQRYTGLASAPAAVPTGNSGLLGSAEDQTGLQIAYGLMVVLTLSGIVVTVRRRRTAS